VKMKDAKPRHTVLIAEGSTESADVLRDALQPDCAVCFAASGEAVLRVMADPATRVDLVLVDLELPGLDGFQVCQRLKAEGATSGIPVLLMAAGGDGRTVARGIGLGAADFVGKPLIPELVAKRIRTHLELCHRTDLLESLASLDGLTCIPDRRRFERILDEEWRRAQRVQAPVGVLMVEVDDFEAYVEHSGHARGDECLKQVAAALTESLTRAGDLVARYDGPNFAVILPNCDEAAATRAAQKLQQHVAELEIPHPAAAEPGHVSLSQGVAATIPARGSSPLQLLSVAALLMEEAKAKGTSHMACSTVDTGGSSL
jgi:diguanylate cyclase (GGDEF)-like protein